MRQRAASYFLRVIWYVCADVIRVLGSNLRRPRIGRIHEIHGRSRPQSASVVRFIYAAVGRFCRRSVCNHRLGALAFRISLASGFGIGAEATYLLPLLRRLRPLALLLPTSPE
jgi:hypothetical protein